MVSKNLHKGKRCFIVGTGASITDIDMSLLKNEITISFNNILLKDDFTPTYLCVADTTVMEKNYDIIFNDRMKDIQMAMAIALWKKVVHVEVSN